MKDFENNSIRECWGPWLSAARGQRVGFSSWECRGQPSAKGTPFSLAHLGVAVDLFQANFLDGLPRFELVRGDGNELVYFYVLAPLER